MKELKRTFLTRKDFQILFDTTEFYYHEPRSSSSESNSYRVVKDQTIDVYSLSEMRDIYSAYTHIPKWKIEEVSFLYTESARLFEPNKLYRVEIRWVDREPTWYERVFKGYKNNEC